MNATVPYGSRVYGTHTDSSDYDQITLVYGAGVDRETVSGGKTWSVDTFQQRLDDHYIVAIEAFSHPGCPEGLSFDLDLAKLRKEISSVSSNSWVKARKKLTVEALKYPDGTDEQQHEIYLGMKSVFHCLRIIRFGIQIAKHGKIVDFSEANHYWNVISKVKGDHWNFYKRNFQQVKNLYMTEFRSLAPKD